MGNFDWAFIFMVSEGFVVVAPKYKWKIMKKRGHVTRGKISGFVSSARCRFKVCFACCNVLRYFGLQLRIAFGFLIKKRYHYISYN